MPNGMMPPPPPSNYIPGSTYVPPSQVKPPAYDTVDANAMQSAGGAAVANPTLLGQAGYQRWEDGSYSPPPSLRFNGQWDYRPLPQPTPPWMHVTGTERPPIIPGLGGNNNVYNMDPRFLPQWIIDYMQQNKQPGISSNWYRPGYYPTNTPM